MFAIIGARPHAVVLIGEEGRIAAAGELDAPAGVPTLDARGMTMLPGLIDGHVHLAWDKSLYAPPTWESYEARLATRNPERDLLRAAHYAQMALAAGVTTVRDCGADDFVLLRLRDAIAAGDLVGPRTLSPPTAATSGRAGAWKAAPRCARLSGCWPPRAWTSSSW
jgi:imidazolonepropionase-like amidohydrolase